MADDRAYTLMCRLEDFSHKLFNRIAYQSSNRHERAFFEILELAKAVLPQHRPLPSQNPPSADKWSKHFMEGAHWAAKMSKDPTTKVGCLIIGPDREIRSGGFNGIPRGVEDRAIRMERPAKYLWFSHAEENAVSHAARIGVSLRGCSVYVTHYPCARCARSLIQAGIVHVFVGSGTTSMPAEEFAVATQMFSEALVEVHQVEVTDEAR